MSRIKVLLADDHAIIRIGIRSILEDESDIEVVGEAADGKDALRKTQQLHPDVIVMDLVMPQLDGIQATEQVMKGHPRTKVIILTTFSTSDGITNAIRSGASGALLKSSADTELPLAIRSVFKGETFISQEVSHLLSKDPPIPMLTDRQLGILHSITRGLTNKDIGKQFGLSEITVRNYLSTIFTKLGASNRSEAVAIALRKQLVKI